MEVFGDCVRNFLFFIDYSTLRVLDERETVSGPSSSCSSMEVASVYVP